MNYRPESTTNRMFSTFIYTAISITALIIIVGCSFFWNYFSEQETILALAKKEALTNFNKDLALRFWATDHGGVYVPVTEKTTANPYLSHIPERDIRTPSGKSLTLMNPAYMIRQVMEGYEKLYGVKGHITSLKPLNPNNEPDSWERLALENFEKGGEEVLEISDLSGKPYLRFIRQMIVKKGCLKCHEHPGYKIGDVRGGISVSVPLSPYLNIERDSLIRIIVFHLLVGILGIIIIVIIALQIKKRAEARQLDQDRIQLTNIELKRRVKERTAELETTNQTLNLKIREAEEAEEQIKENLKEKETLIQKIHQSEKKHREILEGLNDAAYRMSLPDGKYEYISQSAKNIFGYSSNEFLNNPLLVQKIIHPDFVQYFEERWADLNQGIIPKTYEYKIIDPEGNERWIFQSNTLIHDDQNRTIGIEGLCRDITEQKKSDEQIKANLQEKETLLQEIHHRVKNNMTVISSLLGLQIKSITDKKAKEALQDSQSRVQTMSMIHETLYRSDNLSSIDMQTYFTDLGRIIFQGYNVSGKAILKVKAEHIFIGTKQASTLGLIVNELITNSFKYAFPENQKGEIIINLQKIEDQIELEYADNGIGIPEDFDWRNTKSMGLNLVKLLCENQLDGSIEMESNNGTKFTIKFNIET
jgi:PAS domain S-box-containing protein